jgi:hypothetical protein
LDIKSKVGSEAMRFSKESKQRKDSDSIDVDDDIFEDNSSDKGSSPFSRFGGSTFSGSNASQPSSLLGGGQPASMAGSPFGQSAGGVSPFSGGFGASPFAQRQGASPFGLHGSMQGGLNHPQNNKIDLNDEFTKEALKFAGESKKALVGLADSFASFTSTKRADFGRLTVHYSIVFGVMGLLVRIFGGLPVGLDILLGCGIASAIGVQVFSYFYDQSIEMEEDTLRGLSSGDHPFQTPEPNLFSVDDDSFDDDDSLFSEDFEEDDLFENDFEEEDDFFEDDFFEDEEDDVTLVSTKEEFDPKRAEAVLDSTSSTKMMTRAYLYEKFHTVLPSIASNFTKVKIYDDDSDDFFAWDSVVQTSADLFRTNQEDYPELISVKEKLFYVLLEIQRVKWLKNINSFVEEIVSICSYDSGTNKRNSKMHGVGEAVGDRIYVKIYKGDTAMVSIKDIMTHDKNYFLNTGNLIPVSLGIDSEGLPYNVDLKDMNSLIVSGMPRSGKSWFLLSLFSQMMFFNSPDDLHFYFLDPKDTISDYRDVKTPHVKSFVTTDRGILEQLRHLVKVEGVRRTKILGDANVVNIWDYKKQNPDVSMPLIYIVIDEVITLAMRMEESVKEEFQNLLLELVTRLPALGIRIIMVPHLVKNDILRKSITDVIPCKISVCGDSEHIASITGDKKFAFPLENIGDMAVKITGEPKTMFIHGPVVASTNKEIKELISFVDKFWKKAGYESTLENKVTAPKASNVKYVTGDVDNKGFDDLLTGIHDDLDEDLYDGSFDLLED